MKLYALQTKSGRKKEIITNGRFATKEEAEEYAIWATANHEDLKWSDIYDIVTVEGSIEEIKKP